MFLIYTMDKRERLISFINKDEVNHTLILSYLVKHEIPYVENTNGYFFNISLLTDNDVSNILTMYTSEINHIQSDSMIESMETIHINKKDEYEYEPIQYVFTNEDLFLLSLSKYKNINLI